MRIVTSCLLLLATGSMAQFKNNVTYSAECSTATHCRLVEGRSRDAVAWGAFDDAIEKTGMGTLLISTSDRAEAATAAFAAGFVEGALSCIRISQQYMNMAAHYNFTNHPNLQTFLDANDAWLASQVRSNKGDAYWDTIAWQLDQLAGLVEGFSVGWRGEAPALTRRQLLLVNLQGDLDDIIRATDPKARPIIDDMTDDDLRLYELKNTHCSAIVKWLPDGSELFVGHNMWWGYYNMLNVAKIYTFPVKGRQTTIMMSSYPGVLASSDDWYQVSSGLVVMETTNPLYDMTLYDAIHPNTVMYWQRIMAANYLAHNGESWMNIASRHNSGTYNNMWMVVDYKLFKSGQSLVPGTLWIAEQMPGYWKQEDMTTVLSYGYWPSYNRCFFPQTSKLAGQDAMVASRGNYFSYQLTARANVFRRDQTKVDGEEAMRKIMRYNKFQTDPLALGIATNQLAGRGDLNAQPSPQGALNAKFTSSKRFWAGETWVVGGPTHDDVAPFQWSKAPLEVRKEPHYGHPDKFDFDWFVLRSTSLRNQTFAQ